jgi:hypothetical protein
MSELTRRANLRAIVGLALLATYLALVLTGRGAPEALVGFVGGFVLSLWPSPSERNPRHHD